MHLPEFTLVLGGNSRKSSGLSQLVHLQGEMFEDNFYCIRIFFEHLLEQRLNFAAIRSLKIRKNYQLDRGIFVTEKWRTGGVDLLGDADVQGCVAFICLVDQVEGFTSWSNVD